MNFNLGSFGKIWFLRSHNGTALMSFAYLRIEKFSFVSFLTTMTCEENWVRFAISGI
jgi:hypothetical protein